MKDKDKIRAGRPDKPEDEKFNHRHAVNIDDVMDAELRQYKKDNDIHTISDAIRRLMGQALKM